MPEWAPGNTERIAGATPPVHTFAAHSTSLGITFLRDSGFPSDYRGSALVVLKGSWNRKRKSGYKIVSLRWASAPDGSNRIEEREFLGGFERDEDVIGRPVDVVEGSDGSLYVSDDMAGAVYRIRYVPDALATGTEQNENTFALRHERPESPSASPADLTRAEHVALADRGRDLFDRHACTNCHTATESRPAPVPLVGLALTRSIEDVIEALESPPASMPRVLLTDKERRALAIFVLDREHDRSIAGKD